MPGSYVRSTAAFAFYHFVASRIPTHARWAKRLRRASLAGYARSVDPTANINRNARIGKNCTIGPHAGVGDRCVLSGEVHLGPHVTMGPECYFITGDHPIPPDGMYFRDMTSTHRAIHVEEDAFIGARVTILPGVTIGRGAAVGAGTLVAKSVPAGATVVGNPARVIRTRIPPAEGEY